jgi:hypothetical protein
MRKHGRMEVDAEFARRTYGKSRDTGTVMSIFMNKRKMSSNVEV